jgi:hypothetical protein
VTGYTRQNIRSLVDAVIPRTPELAESHGPEHVPGGLDVGIDDYVIESFNSYQEHHLGPLSTVLRALGVRNYPYAVLVALLLDVVAIELLVRGNNEDSVALVSTAPPFRRLSRRDRLRAIELLETGALDTLATKTDDRLPVVGTVRFLALGVNTFPLLGYYSEWPGDTVETNPGWQQTDYPGPAEGYSEHMGYEIDEFDEWDEDEFAPGGDDGPASADDVDAKRAGDSEGDGRADDQRDSEGAE